MNSKGEGHNWTGRAWYISHLRGRGAAPIVPAAYGVAPASLLKCRVWRRGASLGGVAPRLFFRGGRTRASYGRPYQYEVPLLSEASEALRPPNQESLALLRGVPPLRARPGPQADTHLPRPRRTPYSVHAPGKAVKGRGRIFAGQGRGVRMMVTHPHPSPSLTVTRRDRRLSPSGGRDVILAHLIETANGRELPVVGGARCQGLASARRRTPALNVAGMLSKSES